MKKNLANIITSLRIVGALVLIFVPAQTDRFLIIYALCGLTDCIDGFVARTLHIQSELGKKLDSVSDLTFYSVMLIKVWPTMVATLPSWGLGIILGEIGIRLVIYIVYGIIHHRLLSTHILWNKIISIMVFFLPFALRTDFGDKYCYVAMVVAAIALFDELINLKKNTADKA